MLLKLTYPKLVTLGKQLRSAKPLGVWYFLTFAQRVEQM